MEVSKRFRSLDFIKFILAEIIIFHHFQQITGAHFSRINFYGGTISFGYVVEFFFIISGFVTALGVESKSLTSFRNWIMGKCVRLYPMAILSVIVTALVCLLYRFFIGTFPLCGSIELWQLLNSITLTFVGGGVGNIGLGVNNPLWYLCVLLICYVFVYILNWISLQLQISEKYLYFAMMVVGISVVTYKLNLPFLNIATGRGYSAFFFGMIFSYIYKIISKKILITYSGSCIFLYVICTVLKYGIDDQWGIFTFMIWPSVLIIFLSCEKMFKWEGFSLFGAISFEMYLWHLACIFIYMFIKNLKGSNVYSVVEMLIFSIIVILFSCILYLFENKIVTNLKNQIENK